MNFNKSKIIYFSEFILGELFIIYCIILHFINPGTLLSELCSFSNVWLFLGALLIFLSTYRKNHQKSFWSALKKWQKVSFMVIFGAGITISAINLYFIRHPAIAKKPDANIVILLGGKIQNEMIGDKGLQVGSSGLITSAASAGDLCQQ